MRKIRWWSPESIRFKLLAGLLVAIIPLTALLVYHNFYSINVVRDQVTGSYRKILALGVDRIDGDLDAAERYLRYFPVASADLLTMETSQDDTNYQLAKIRLAAKFKSDLLLYRSIRALFVFSVKHQDFLQVFTTGSTFDERQAIQRFIEAHATGFPRLEAELAPFWRIEKIGSTYYLLRVIHVDDIIVGAWLPLESLLVPLKDLDLGTDGRMLLTRPDGTVLVQANPAHSMRAITGYIQIRAPSERSAFQLLVQIPEAYILQQLPFLQWIIILVSLFGLVFPVFGLRLLHKMMIKPLDSLVGTIERIALGHLHERVSETASSFEFTALAANFNVMMDEIDRLKIGIYEQQLNKQQEELMRLQAQMNPHFFLNSLNIMYNLVQTKDYALIQDLTLCLVAYFRFMVRSESSLISLGDELNHVRNYHRIQEMRFPGQQILEISVPDFLREALVPPLIIQTFVENTIKYGNTRSGQTVIRIDAEYRTIEGQENVEILIQDNGPGFPPEILCTDMGANSRPTSGNDHIGIFNIQRRLAILYGNRCSLELFNSAPSGGAAIRIQVPFGISSS